MRKILTVLMGVMLIMTLLVCSAMAEIITDPTAPINPGDISWLTASVDFTIVGICLVVGLLVKHCTSLNNRYIPLIVAGLGLIVAVWTHWAEGITPVVLLEGLFSGLASTGFHQVFKQLFFEV